MHASTARANVPKRESEERQLQIQVGLRNILPAFWLPKVWRLHEIVNVQPTRKSLFVVDYELPISRIALLKRPSIKTGVNKRNRPRKVDEGPDSEGRDCL